MNLKVLILNMRSVEFHQVVGKGGDEKNRSKSHHQTVCGEGSAWLWKWREDLIEHELPMS